MSAPIFADSDVAKRQWFIVGRWEEYEGESRANLLRIISIGAFYIVELLNHYYFEVVDERFHQTVTALAVAWTMVALATHLCLRRRIFPPALTANYHFNAGGKFQPYVGAGVQYINFFNTGTGDNLLGAQDVSIDDAWGFTLQAGLDVGLGNGWSLNFDVKKTWLDTTVTWHNNAALGGLNVVGDADLDPWIFSAGLGYRFNLFGHGAEAAPIK